jgi:hypothetical protein
MGLAGLRSDENFRLLCQVNYGWSPVAFVSPDNFMVTLTYHKLLTKFDLI